MYKGLGDLFQFSKEVISGLGLLFFWFEVQCVFYFFLFFNILYWYCKEFIFIYQVNVE